ncbi:LacI family DNA-binding transcriptional regulator [Conexibacter sp. CPCC 206217]|uniref:LacI family DNA-binding transcriptional regulator n=1 Tax=Conexibacter sp. CPCC 206217 TaxID=3064574 RepID=UPI002726D51A|nr:LacI family DNA-binding transcriptional regulator [Conexibacter sp. CPCC 206217]MDO8210185.1 LacI family DNA-binding transcriptional regulator [Conexibacter sp. CPCC 206217]
MTAPTAGNDGIPRLGDVARLAGVSVSTVSRYVRRLPVRRPDEIAAAIEQLNYRPNEIARGLRSRVTHAIGVVVADITNPYLASVVRGIQSVGGTSEYKLYLAGSSERLPETIADLGSRIDGFICAAASEPEVVEALRATGQPTVLLEFEPIGHPHPFDVVVVDDFGGARLAGDYLLQLGHKRIGIIGGPMTTSPGKQRHDGFVSALDAAGLELDESYVEYGDFSAASGYQAAARLLSRDRPATAIFSVNNMMSLGALKYMHDLKVRIPGDVAFIGFDPIDWSELMHPAPTTVERPRSEQGAIGMRLLLDRIAGRGPTGPRRIVLDAHLAVRGSCGPPPADAS